MAPGSSSTVRSSGMLKPATSSPQWQIFLFLHSYYFTAMILAELFIFIWKGSILPYSEGVLSLEIVLLLLISFLEIGRFFWGMKGNLTERRLACFISIAMGITSVGGGLYFVLWQTYVLMLEAILFIIHMALVVIETIFGLVTFFAIQKSLST